MNKIVVAVGVIVILAGAAFSFWSYKNKSANDSLSESQNNQLESLPMENVQMPEESDEGSQPSSYLKIEAVAPMKIEVIQEGTGIEAKKGDLVSVHYRGRFENGTQFDSSLDRKEPFSFVLGEGRVIQGWEEGVPGMKVGEKRLLIIGPELAYGAKGIPGAIPPNAILIFEVELLKIN